MFKSNESQNTYDGKIEFHYKICFIMSIVLAVLRIIAFDFLSALSDGLSALIIYLTYTQRSKLMAIFCLIGGGLGFIFATIKFSNFIGVIKNSRKAYTIIVFLIIIYSVIVYTYLAIVSFFAYRQYTEGCPCPQVGSSSQGVSTNYGSVNTHDEEKQGFTAFSGKGVSLA